ncbi:hypothetical protein CLV78_101856 [Aliiruegeria haliotis]|uniref:DUF3887 domain-containing protein n=1 Tax=Aliiruegeria haliotis TaxID=1280846 RepID=A0A2T0S002_9RHOB|nr:hypothetical protein [Aliiruegeria haliotis]PRY26754.1 hypothetical protein CLV78_101856 [Aliiruegeria haliotis]
MRNILVATLLSLSLLPFGSTATAQDRPSVFEDYASFEAFIDEKIMAREFGVLFQAMGGGQNLKLADLQSITSQTRAMFPRDFEAVQVIKRDEMDGGFAAEGRVYWVGETYAFVYVLLHDRGDEIVVINLALHGAPGPLLSMF